MKKIIVLSAFCSACLLSYSQDSMSKKVENKTDKMNKKMENKSDKMNKKMGNMGDSMKTNTNRQKDTAVHKIRKAITTSK